MPTFLSILRLLAGLVILATAVPAVLAVFGFAVPEFDLLNHAQPALFAGTLVGLVLALALRMEGVGLALAIAGFAASALIVVPEWVSGLAPRPPAPAGMQTLKLMTHNIFGHNTDMERLAGVIADENPDIIALQEYFPQQAKALSKLLGKTYPYSVQCFGGKRANLALYSKFAFDEEMTPDDCPPDASSKQRTGQIVAVFRLADGRHFSVLTTHMDWPLPIERQRDEFAAVARTAAGIDGPLIVVGDFNSTPWSYALRSFETDTGMRRETRSLMTFPVLFTIGRQWHTIPFLPLDQVFERGIVVHALGAGPETGSDHLPVVLEFSVAG